jgi:hypothetical protein
VKGKVKKIIVEASKGNVYRKNTKYWGYSPN